MEDLVVSLGAAVWRLQLGSPMGSLEQHPELMIDPDDLPGIVDFVVDAKQRSRTAISVGDNIGYFSHHEEALRATVNRDGFNFWCGCSAGCLTIGIEANGNVKSCLSLQSDDFVEGNIRDFSLAELWHRPGAFADTRGFEIGNRRSSAKSLIKLVNVGEHGLAFLAPCDGRDSLADILAYVGPNNRETVLTYYRALFDRDLLTWEVRS